MTVHGTGARQAWAHKPFPLFLATRVRTGRDEVPAHLLDLSVSGALLTAPQPPAVGSRIQLRLPTGVRAAEVVQRHGRQLGVRFVAPLAGAEVANLIGKHEALAAYDQSDPRSTATSATRR